MIELSKLLAALREAVHGPKRTLQSVAVAAASGGKADIDTRVQSSRLAKLGGRGMSFKICRGTRAGGDNGALAGELFLPF